MMIDDVVTGAKGARDRKLILQLGLLAVMLISAGLGLWMLG
jgi:hypothetical protein